jgi:hypothetical protein
LGRLTNSVNDDATFVRFDKAEEAEGEGALSTSCSSDNSNLFSRFHVKGDAVEDVG